MSSVECNPNWGGQCHSRRVTPTANDLGLGQQAQHADTHIPTITYRGHGGFCKAALSYEWCSPVWRRLVTGKMLVRSYSSFQANNASADWCESGVHWPGRRALKVNICMFGDLVAMQSEVRLQYSSATKARAFWLETYQTYWNVWNSEQVSSLKFCLLFVSTATGCCCAGHAALQTFVAQYFVREDILRHTWTSMLFCFCGRCAVLVESRTMPWKWWHPHSISIWRRTSRLCQELCRAFFWSCMRTVLVKRRITILFLFATTLDFGLTAGLTFEKQSTCAKWHPVWF